MTRAPISVLIPTYNEELNLPGCLSTLAGWAGEIVVVDSFSSDGTRDIALQSGARVVEHRFEGYSQQKNWALENVAFAYEWILSVDADERVRPELAIEITDLLKSDGNGNQGFYVNRQFIFMGRWLRRGGLYPSWSIRLFRKNARFEHRLVNEHVMLKGGIGYVKEPLEHHDLRSLSDWVAKHNKYATLEAQEFLRERNQRDPMARFLGGAVERKRWIKARVWNRAPLLFRPFMFLLRNYFFKRGFLDGKPGFIYHVLWSFWYPFLIDAKIVELAGGETAPAPSRGKRSTTSAKDR
jgi:glycosyltransferase involved in cell wall biosynthesis